jgi:hypothetical protein
MTETFPYDDVLMGKGNAIAFPEDPFVRWELVHQFPERCKTPEKGHATVIWFIEKAPIEWSQFFISNLLLYWRPTGNLWLLTQFLSRDARIQEFITEYAQIIEM